MKVVSVVPLTRAPLGAELTYFTAAEVVPGALVVVPVKNRQIDALVTKVTVVDNVKMAVKTANYPLRKVSQVKAKQFFLPPFLAAAHRAADYFAAELGPTIKHFVPQPIINEPDPKSKIVSPPPPSPVAGRDEKKVKIDKLVLQESDAERHIHYKSLIREEFARGHSVFFCVPTVTDVERTAEIISKGIANYTVVLHHRLSASKLKSEWQHAVEMEHPILVIATPLFLSLPRHDWRALIVDQESSPAYKSLTRPFVDARKFTEFLAETLGAKLIFGDTVLRAETVYRTQRGDLLQLSPLKHHIASGADYHLIDLAKNKELSGGVSHDLLALIDYARKQSEKVFIFSHRRGLSPIIVCQDCGQLVRCRRCAAPVVLHQQQIFLCHHCGDERQSDEMCRNCESWRLTELGTGIDQVAKAISTAFPDLPLAQLDSDSVKTSKQAEGIVRKFMASSGGVIIGTEMALYYLKERVENVAIAAIDSMLALPDFRTNERVFGLLSRLRGMASKRLVLQTRHPEHGLFDLGLKGQVLDFYRQEIAERKTFGYPPFTILIKISVTGRKQDVLPKVKHLADKFKDYEPDAYPSRHLSGNENYRGNILIRRKPEEWPEESLVTLLKHLGRADEVTVDVDPADVL